MRLPRLFPRSKKQVALSPAPGHYSNDDPEKIIFDQGTRLRVEANHWKTFCFVLAIIAGGAVYTRQPPPSVVRAYGVSSDAGGNPLVKQLAAYNPDDQAKRTAIKQDVEHWFTIEPVLTDDIRTSRLAKNINAVKAKMVGNAKNQFASWISDDKPFDQITTNPKLVREPKVTNVSLLEDSTVVVEFTTSTRQSPTDKPVDVRFALTMRYQIIPPTAEDVLPHAGRIRFHTQRDRKCPPVPQ